MFTVGPRLTIAPLPCSSEPITSPYWRASDLSKLAASPTEAGSSVTPVRPSPTPSGPSSSPIGGRQRLGIPEMKNT